MDAVERAKKPASAEEPKRPASVEEAYQQTMRRASDAYFDFVADRIGLSPGVRDVVALVVDGVETKEIARRLKKALPTIAGRLSDAFDYADVTNRDELVAAMLGRTSMPPPRARSSATLTRAAVAEKVRRAKTSPGRAAVARG